MKQMLLWCAWKGCWANSKKINFFRLSKHHNLKKGCWPKEESVLHLITFLIFLFIFFVFLFIFFLLLFICVIVCFCRILNFELGIKLDIILLGLYSHTFKIWCLEKLKFKSWFRNPNDKRKIQKLLMSLDQKNSTV